MAPLLRSHVCPISAATPPDCFVAEEVAKRQAATNMYPSAGNSLATATTRFNLHSPGDIRICKLSSNDSR